MGCAVSAPASAVIAAVAGVMRSADVRWYLFGAQAVMVWGRPRMSVDVDVTAQVALEDAGRFAEVMTEAGFRLRVPDPEAFATKTRVLPFVHVATGVPLDVVCAGPGLEEQFLERAREVRIGGVVVPVISPEDLIVAKVLAGRPKDVEDVRGILQERLDELDLDRVRQDLSMIEQALSRGDLLPILDRELSAARQG